MKGMEQNGDYLRIESVFFVIHRIESVICLRLIVRPITYFKYQPRVIKLKRFETRHPEFTL